MTTATLLESMRTTDGFLAALRSHGPRVVTVVLALALAAQAAILVTDYFGASDRPLTSAPALTRSGTQARSLDLAAMLNAHLFGKAAADPATSGANAPRTSLSLVLAGVLAQTDPEKGLALVGESAATAKVHAVGDSLPGGVTLHGVYIDRVVLDRAGALESLFLPHQPAPGGLATPAPLAGPALGAADRVRQLIQQDPNALNNLLRWQQVMNREGKMSGVRVYPERNPGAFAKLGLRAGDLITAVNGTSLDDPSRGDEILRSLGSMPEAKVTVMRNGRQTDLMLNLTQALSEAETIVNPEVAPPVEAQPPMPIPRSQP